MTGIGLAVLIFLIYQGFDVTPLLVIGTMFFVLRFLIEGRGDGKKFESLRANAASGLAIPSVSFEDIGGQEVAKRELKEALNLMRNEERARKLGIRPLKGILLAGPPGTGKTLMAKAAANYTDSVFLSAVGSEFVEMYAGVGASRVRKLFKKAYQDADKASKSSAIIFIDEIDVLGAKRGRNSGHMEYDQTLNELLTQIDGIRVGQKIKVLVVGATNRVDMLDPALMRPGRFDRIVKVDLPDKNGRLHILKIHARNKPLAQDVDLEAVAKETFGFSGAHLESVLNEAAIYALRKNRSEISASDLRDAIEKVMLGEKLDRHPSLEEKRRIAYHEIGHAILGEVNRAGSVSSITISSRGNALGYMRLSPADDQYLYTKDELAGRIQVCLAGAVAEELVFGQRSTGAVNDIEQATEIAKKMILSGLSDLGIVSKDIPQTIIHEGITKIIKEQEQLVKEILLKFKKEMEMLASHLLENEKISGSIFRQMLKAAV